MNSKLDQVFQRRDLSQPFDIALQLLFLHRYLIMLNT